MLCWRGLLVSAGVEVATVAAAVGHIAAANTTVRAVAAPTTAALAACQVCRRVLLSSTWHARPQFLTSSASAWVREGVVFGRRGFGPSGVAKSAAMSAIACHRHVSISRELVAAPPAVS